MRKLITLITIILLSGCSSLGLNLGISEYSIEPVILADGSTSWKALVYNSKDYDSLKFTIEKGKDGTIKVTLDEKGVSATDPATVAAQNQAKMLDVFNRLIPTP